MSAPSHPFYAVRWPNGGQTNATDYQSARIIAAMVPGARVVFSHSSTEIRR